MAKRIIGNPTTTPNPQSDLMQNDSAKADFVKGKEQFIDEITKNLPSQDVSFEKTVSGTTDDGVSISDFALSPIKIKTAQPNRCVNILAYGYDGSLLGISNVDTDSNGEYVYNPIEEEMRIEFCGAVCDFTVTYEVNINKVIKQVDKNTEEIFFIEEDIAELEKDVGDIETALDSIIAIQNKLLGVSE